MWPESDTTISEEEYKWGYIYKGNKDKMNTGIKENRKQERVEQFRDKKVNGEWWDKSEQFKRKEDKVEEEIKVGK